MDLKWHRSLRCTCSLYPPSSKWQKNRCQYFVSIGAFRTGQQGALRHSANAPNTACVFFFCVYCNLTVSYACLLTIILKVKAGLKHRKPTYTDRIVHVSPFHVDQKNLLPLNSSLGVY